MHIFEIAVPGTWLNYTDGDWCWRMQGLLGHLQSQFFDANAALNLFEDARSKSIEPKDGLSWERDKARQSEIRSQIEAEVGAGFGRQQWEAIQLEAEIRFKRERWSQGCSPREFKHAEPFMYARAFLYALDGFDKFLGVLSKEVDAPEKLASIHKDISTAFPDLRGVRDTAQHPEDRARGLDRNKKPLNLKPVANTMINAPGGVLIMNSLNGSKYGATMTDGHYGEV